MGGCIEITVSEDSRKITGLSMNNIRMLMIVHAFTTVEHRSNETVLGYKKYVAGGDIGDTTYP